MKEEEQMVILKNKRGDKEAFKLPHALILLRLLKEKNLDGWVLADKKWEFKNNEINRRPNQGEVKKSDQ